MWPGRSRPRFDSRFSGDRYDRKPLMISKVERRRALLTLNQKQAANGNPGPLAISEVRAFSMAGTTGSYVLLRVQTQSGIIGYGECKDFSGSDLKATNEA